MWRDAALQAVFAEGALVALYDTEVRPRVTFSYFVEPNPARRGCTKRHRYQSVGLRFAVRSAAETTDNLCKRLNKLAVDDDQGRPSADGDGGWFLGSSARNRGSLHADSWRGTAAELADRGVIAVYPLTGW